MELDANKYYESLRFNHYKSGGTCEQRTLVLRVRFDSILEDLLVSDYTSQKEFGKDFYTERLKMLFEKYPSSFSETKKREIDDLRRFLNGVQHSEIIPEENDYVKSLKTLCELISICSQKPIPQDLLKINSIKENKDKNKENNTLMPVCLIIDTLETVSDSKMRQKLNDLLKIFINKIISDEIKIDLSIVLIESNGNKVIKPLTKSSSLHKNSNSDSTYVNEAITLGSIEISGGLKKISNTSRMRIKSLMFILLSSTSLNMIKPSRELLKLQKNNDTIVFPIELDKKLMIEKFASISPNREAIVLPQSKFSEFFSWLFECVKIGSKNSGICGK